MFLAFCPFAWALEKRAAAAPKPSECFLWGTARISTAGVFASVRAARKEIVGVVPLNGKPAQNGHIESFNGRLREECLNANWFINLPDARRKIASWHRDYNECRPHSALGYRTPREFAGTLPFALSTFNATDRSRPQGYPTGALTCGLDPARDLNSSTHSSAKRRCESN